MKIYGGDTSVAPTEDDVDQATEVFREELAILNRLFTGYDLTTFLDPECDPFERYRQLAKAAEFVFASTEVLNSESKSGKSTKKVLLKSISWRLLSVCALPMIFASRPENLGKRNPLLHNVIWRLPDLYER